MLRSKIVVLGLGNVLAGDDSFGPHIIHLLQQIYSFVPEIDLIDMGTPGLDLTLELAERQYAVVVDTVDADIKAGSVEVFDLHSWLTQSLAPRTSPHAPTLHQALLTLDLQGLLPTQGELVAVVPKHVEIGVSMSAEVKQALPISIKAILTALAMQNVEAKQKYALNVAKAPWWISRGIGSKRSWGSQSSSTDY